MAQAKNIRTGQIVSVPEHYITHPVLGKNLAAVGTEVQAAPKKEKKQKEQPAPEVQPEVVEPEFNIIENEGTEDVY